MHRHTHTHRKHYEKRENIKYMLSLTCWPHTYRSGSSSLESTELVGCIHFNAGTVWMISFLWSLCRWPSAAYVRIYCIMAKKLERPHFFFYFTEGRLSIQLLLWETKGLSSLPKVWMISSSKMKRHMVRQSWRRGGLMSGFVKAAD